MARWFFSFQAMDPKDLGSRWEVGIQEWLYRKHQHHGNERVLARLRLVQDVLERGTLQIYEGWSRPQKEEDCFVYVGRPARDFKSYTIETPAPPNMVFLVFVLPDGEIDEWTWRQIEQGVNPQGVTGKLIWQAKRS